MQISFFQRASYLKRSIILLTFDVYDIFVDFPSMNEPNALTRWFPCCCFIIESCQRLANRKSIYWYTKKLTDTTTYHRLINNRRINELAERWPASIQDDERILKEIKSNVTLYQIKTHQKDIGGREHIFDTVRRLISRGRLMDQPNPLTRPRCYSLAGRFAVVM